MSIIAEAPGYLQVFSDGSVKRFTSEIALASSDSSNGYKSRDVIIDPLKPITGRLFIPITIGIETSTSTNIVVGHEQFPIIVYFHGGGFCIGSTTWLGYHIFLGDLSVATQAIILSVDYRLAPENRLPIAYSDCYSSLEWLSNQVKIDPYLKKVDLSRVFLSGDSAGGNIAHNVAIQAIKYKNSTMKIRGIIPIHPYFGSEKRTPKETVNEEGEDVRSNDMFWRLSIPDGSNRDYFGCNFDKSEVSADEWSRFPKVVVYVAELDFLMERGVMYADFLRKKGVKDVYLIEVKGEKHIYHVFNPRCEATYLLQKQISEFVNIY